MFKKMRGIDYAFRVVLVFSVIVVAGCMALLSLVLYQRHTEIVAGTGRVYVLANGKAIEAFASSRRDNLVVEGIDHVKMFHINFFSLEPDEKVIQANISNALYLADESAKRQYFNLKENGFYADIIAGNVSQSVSVDSVIVDDSRVPIYFRFYGKELIKRTSGRTTFSMITEGSLREVERSVNNSHGFLITHWNILENKELGNGKK